MATKLHLAWKIFRISLGILCITLIIMWGANWIVARQYLTPPDSDLINQILGLGVWAGFLFGVNWKWRGIGAVIGLVTTYLYLYLAVLFNRATFLSN